MMDYKAYYTDDQAMELAKAFAKSIVEHKATMRMVNDALCMAQNMIFPGGILEPVNHTGEADEG